MDIVTTTKALQELCTELAADSFVTVDTEFMREKTYWPDLCLIQIAGSKREAIIDPQAAGIDLAALFDLMNNANVLKVFHAARQDLEIFYHLSGVIPHPLFDTQVAAMVCGFGDQIGYEPLARRLANAEIDKTSRFTDWSKRPLSNKQLTYALSDVTHLRVIYSNLKKQLDASGREAWIDEEMAILTSPETYSNAPEDAWKRIKFRARNKRQLAVLMELARWRERTAQKRNVPKNRIVKDDALSELAMQQPNSLEALNGLRALPRGFANSNHAAALLKAIAAGQARDPETVPDLNHKRQTPPEGAGAIADILKLALKVISDRQGIAPKLIASSADLERLAAGDTEACPALKGWRREAFGDLALDLMAGRKAIALVDGKTAIVPFDSEVAAMKAAE